MSKYFFLFIILILFSCEREKEIKTFGETEYYFDEKLSSISLGNNGNFWIGSETGDLFYLKGNQRFSYELPEDRIYKVINEINAQGDTVFWIGVRNSGLQKWIKKVGSGLEKTKTYNIDIKQNQYSPYDLLKINNRIFVATSQGFFYLDTTVETDTLILIYSSDEYLSREENNTFLVHNLCNYKDSLLLASTERGLLMYNMNNESKSFLLEEKHIQHVSVYQDTIFTVTDESLNLSNFKGNILKRIPTDNSPRVYYQNQNIHYLIGSDKIIASKDLKEFVDIQPRRFIPLHCRNIILPDTINNFTYLLTENAVWRIPNTIDVFKSNKSVKASCFADRKTYYLTHENELYVQMPGNKNAKWIYTFPKDNIIDWIQTIGKDLYVCNVDNVFQKIALSDNRLINMFWNSPEVIYRSKVKIFSINIKNMGDKLISFLGTREGLISIDSNQKIDTIPELYGMYISSLFGHEYSGRIYISTLNNGVYYISQDNVIKKVPETEKRYFIRDIAATNDHNANLIMLTNQQIISQNPPDSIRVKGYQKLLYVNDSTFYAIPEFGIHKFSIANNKIQDRGILYADIQFNKNSTFAIRDHIFLGSSTGAFTLTVDDDSVPLWIDFEQAPNTNLFYILSILIILIGMALIGLIILLRKQNANKIEITRHKDDLQKRINDLLSYSNILEKDEKAEVMKIRNMISSLSMHPKESKNTKNELDSYSIRLAQINREIGLLIPIKLNELIIELNKIELFEKKLLIETSQEIKNNKDIHEINEQIKKNALWIEQRDSFIEELDKTLAEISGWVEIENVNRGLYGRMKNIRDSLKNQPLATLIDAFNHIKEEINKINTPETSTKIEAYIHHLDEYLNPKTTMDARVSFLIDNLNELKAKKPFIENLIFLKALTPIEQQISVLSKLNEIKTLSTRYRDEHDRIIKENDAFINKKFDKDLSDRIAENTKNITQQINIRIDELYEQLLLTDHHIIIDTLKLNNIKGQHAKVLAILIADLKVKRSLIPGMLGIYGNLNPVISRLINERVRANENYLRIYFSEQNHKTIFIHLLLHLLD